MEPQTFTDGAADLEAGNGAADLPVLLPGPGRGGAIAVPDATTMRFGPSPTWVADLRVSLERSIADLSIVLRPAARISGRVVFDGGQPPGERLR